MSDIVKELCACTGEDPGAFTFLSADDLTKVASFFHRKNFRAGDILWNEGDHCDYVAFIASGRVQVKKKTKLKENQVVLGIYSKGVYIGALCILDGSPRAVTAEAMDDVCALCINRNDFEQLTNQFPDIGASLMKGMLLAVSKSLKNSFNRLVAIF